MHDGQLEERLRRVLRAEGDSLRLTITPAELHRHLALRQRGRSSRRLLIGAAAALVLAAVALSAALFFNREGTPSVGTSPSPSPTASGVASVPAASISPVADIAPYEGWQTLARLSGPDRQAVSTVAGPVPSGIHLLLVSAACQGNGSLAITMAGDSSLAVDCPSASTKPSRTTSTADSATGFSVGVAASGAVRYQVLIEGSDLLLHVPAIVLRHGTDQVTMGRGCGGAISLGWGYDTSDQCATTLPSTPLETLGVVQGDIATVTIDGWTVTDTGATCGRVNASAGSPDRYEEMAQCTVTAALKDSVISVTELPRAAAAWVVELTVTARNAAGDSFSGPFYASVVVR